MKIIEEQGNLFDLNKKYSLAHCISLDCAMGAGIAVAFDKNFKGMKNGLRNAIDEYGFKSPVTLKWFSSTYDGVIFNLITKEKYWHKPTYGTITECIKQMASDCKSRNIRYLAIPKIGCGLDGLIWSKVRNIIEEEFNEMDIEIVVRYL